jgi:hypothetical protein
MQETFFIFLHFFFLLILFFFPFHFLKNNLIFLKNLNFYDLICINILTQFTLYLFLSFFFSNISHLLVGIFFLSFILLFFSGVKNFFKIKNNIFLLVSIFLFFIIVICNFVTIAYNVRLEWDAIAHWFWKVQNFYQGGKLENFKNLPYPFYPHLGTYLWSNFLRISYLDYEYFGRLYYAFVYIVSIFSITYSVNKNYFILVTCIVSFLIFDLFALGGYQDFLVFFFITFISKLFFLLTEKKISNNFFIIFFLLILNLLIWTKQEGVIYALIFYFIFITLLKFKFKKNLFFSLSLFALIFIYFYLNNLLKGSGFFHEPIVNDFKKLKDFYLFFESFIYISLNLIISLIQRPVILLSIPLYFILKYKQKENFFKINFINLFFISNIFIVYGIFFHTGYPLEGVVPHVLDRLLLQTSGFYLIVLIYYFNFISKNEK